MIAGSSALALSLVWAAALVHSLAGLAAAGWLAGLALAVYVLLQARALPGMGRLVLAGALLASALSLAVIDDHAAALAKAAGTASFFVAVLLSGGFLREAAERSDMVRRAGAALIGQPPARRNAALSFGGFAMGFILGFGTLQLLGAMVKQANTLEQAGGEARVQAIRERRSMLAVLRGFCMSTVTNPISIVLALALTYAPGTEVAALMPLVFAGAVAGLTIGGLLDWLAGPRIAPPAAGSVPSLRPVGGLVAFVLFVFACVFTVAWALELRIIQAVLLSVPAIAAGWMLRQEAGRPAGLARRLVTQALTRYPAQRMEVVILASAGFAGTLIATALPIEAIAARFDALAIPGALLPLLIFLFVVAGAQLALNPILTVTIAGAVLPAPLALGAPPEVVAAAYMTAWGVGTVGSPFTLSVLIVSGIAEKDSRTVAWRWNGAFFLTMVAAMGAWLTLMATIG